MPVDKYIPNKLEIRQTIAPRSLFIISWMVLFVLALFFADELRYRTEERQSHPYAIWIAKSLQTTAQTIGIKQTKIIKRLIAEDRLDEMRSTEEDLPSIPRETIGVKIIHESQTYQNPTPSNPEEVLLGDPNGSPYFAKPNLPDKILLIGASSMRSYMGQRLELEFSHLNRHTHRSAKLGTGLSRPDTFNWFEVAPKLAKEHQSELVIMQFIGNDGQSLINPDGSIHTLARDPLWDEAYSNRFGAFIQQFTDIGLEVVVIGMPMVENQAFRNRLQNMNQLIQKECLSKGALFVSLWEASQNKSGDLRTEIRIDHRTYAFRHPDGIHFTKQGGYFMANVILEEMGLHYSF